MAADDSEQLRLACRRAAAHVAAKQHRDVAAKVKADIADPRPPERGLRTNFFQGSQYLFQNIQWSRSRGAPSTAQRSNGGVLRGAENPGNSAATGVTAWLQRSRANRHNS